MLLREKLVQTELAAARLGIREVGGNNHGPWVKKFLAEVQKRPAPPTMAEKVATAIAAAPEIGAATKKALAAALAPPSP